MLTGVHAILYSSNPEADRALLRDVLHLANVDAGEGWLIFALPPAEMAVHPAEASGGQEIYLICDDIQTFMREMTEHGIECSGVQALSWGLLTRISLPGGGQLGVYESRHARPE